MIRAVRNTVNSAGVTFSGDNGEAQPAKKLKYDHDTLLKNNLVNRTRIAFDKLSNAATIYTAKGITGNKNANFYEFLTMGTIPYILGSLTFMGVFNSAAKHFDSFSRSRAYKLGNKMALGVIFYALGKSLSKSLVSTPVRLATGVDINLPYAKVNYELPENKNDTDITSIEYHKVYESVEFPRWDLLYNYEKNGQSRNAYYDKVAKKLGMGTDLKDSDQEVKPRIKEIITKTTAIKNIVPYLWAALGVGIAVQKPWETFLATHKFKTYKVSEFTNNGKTFMQKLSGTAKNTGSYAWQTLGDFGDTFKTALKDLYNGKMTGSKAAKTAGKIAVWLPIAATILGDAIIISSGKKATKSVGKPVVDTDKKYTVG